MINVANPILQSIYFYEKEYGMRHIWLIFNDPFHNDNFYFLDLEIIDEKRETFNKKG